MPKTIKTLLKIVTILVVVVFLALLGLNYYLNGHKEELFAKVETWYNDTFNGTLYFDDLSLSTLKNLPNVSFTVKNLLISDCEYSQFDVLRVGELQISVSLAKILQKKIEIKFVKILNGQLNLITDIEGCSNSSVFTPKAKDSAVSEKQEMQLSEKKIKLSIENFGISLINFQKNKRIRGHVKDIGAVIDFQDERVSAVVDMNLQMQEMGLNLEKGTFFNDALLSGSYELSFDKEKKEINIPDFDLQIDQQMFGVRALLSMKDEGAFHITLENKKTRLKPTIRLLSQNIQAKLEKYNTAKPIYTYTLLEGSFAPGSNVFVSVNASTKNNSLSVDETQIENVSFKGNFTNRANAQGKNIPAHKKDLRLNFDELSGVYKNIPFTFNKAIYTSTPKVKNLLDFDLSIDAEAILLNDFFKNENFVFTDGNFTFDASYSGNLMSIDSLVDASTSNLRFGNSTLLYKPEQLEIGIDTLAMELDKKDAFLTQLVLPIKGTSSKIRFSGNIMNVSALVLDRNEKVRSELAVYSASLVWDDFYYLFKTTKPKKASSAKTDAVVIAQMIDAFYTKFDPELKVKIDKFQYNKLIVSDFTTFLHFTSINEVVLENTGFTYHDKGKVTMEMRLDVSRTDITKFDFDLAANQLDLGELLKEFDYFSIASLKNAQKLDGNISLDADFQGDIIRAVGLDHNTLTGTIRFDLTDLEINGFAPITKVADKVFKKQRFENIKIGPIKDTLFIANRTITFPQMEIQSTAFNLFVEGHLNYDNNTNIWVSVPLSNFKSRDLVDIPDQEGFIAAGKKVYVQIKDDGTGKLEYKLHLNNKKLYEEKGIVDQYKEDRKEAKEIRREDRKEERKEARENKRDSIH